MAKYTITGESTMKTCKHKNCNVNFLLSKVATAAIKEASETYHAEKDLRENNPMDQLIKALKMIKHENAFAQKEYNKDSFEPSIRVVGWSLVDLNKDHCEG